MNVNRIKAWIGSKERFMLLLLLSLSLSITAQIPAGYYNGAEGKSKAELKTALHNIISKGKRLSYGSGAGKTWSGFEKTDLRPDGTVWDMYSLVKRTFPGNGKVPDGMNIEHSVAKSWWGGSTNDAYKDLYHLNPSDSRANSARSNYPLGINDGSDFDNGAIKVGKNTYGSRYTGLCFEPLDEYKGDFARAYMYMFTCYENFSWTGNSVNMLNTSETYPMLQQWAKDLLLEWSRKDPVSAKERNRAEAIAKIQENRNPFIDYPELAEYLWGNKVGQPFTTNQTEPVITTPSNNSTIEMPTTHYTATSVMQILVQGQRLNGNITLKLSGLQSGQFTVSPTVITKEEAAAGKNVTITFMPLKAESATAQLTIEGGGVAQQVTVTLQATAIESFMALQATEIGQRQFTANWSAASTATNYELNVYQLISQGTGGEEVIFQSSFDKLPAGWSTDGYTAQEDGATRLASGKQNGVLISPPINLSSSVTLIVKAKRYGDDKEPKLYISVDNKEVGTITTTEKTGEFRIIMPTGTDQSEIQIKALKGNRVYVSHVSLVTPGESVVTVPISGYPVLTGKVSSYTVTNLQPDQVYYYTVKTIGPKPATSEVITVKTRINTSVGSTELDKVKLTSKDGVIYFFNLPPDCIIRVSDLSGKVLKSLKSTSPHEMMEITTNGIVLINITHKKGIRTIKTTLRQ